MATTGRTVTYKLEIDWNFNGTYTDETEYLVRASGDYRINAPGSSILSPRGIIPQMSITLDNDGRFSPFNSAGALYSHLQDGKAYHAPVKFSVQIDAGSFVRVFTGYLKTPTDAAVTSVSSPTVTFDCRGPEERLQQQRLSTTMADFAGYYDDGKTEAEIITAWLTQAGQTPSAGEIDRGLFVIPAAWLDDESPLSDIWHLAAAAGGWAYSARTGEMLYRNATHLADGTAASETLDKGDYAMLSVRYDDKELYSTVIVEAAPRVTQGESVLWEPDEIPVIPADETVTITAALRQPAHSLSGLSYDAVTFGGVDISSDVSETVGQFAQRLEIEFTNANTTYAAQLRNMQLLGVPVTGDVTTEEKAESVDAFWNAAYNRDDRSRTLRGNVYIQSTAQAAMLAEMLRDWHETPRVFMQVDGVPGVPGRDLLDRITISNADILSSSVDMFVTSIRWTADRNGFAQSLQGIAADGFYPYADETEGYFIIGSSGNRLGATGGTNRARLFY